MLERKRNFQLLYPDVLGIVTGGTRINFDHLQAALGVFPRYAYINQPFEAIVALQSMVSQPMQVKVAIRLPTADRKGSPAVVDTPKPQITLTLQPGEAGILRMPIIARPPTQPGKDFPIRLAIRYRVAENVEWMRPPSGGALPSVVDVSPLKLQVLREITFKAETWGDSPDIITAYFDLAPHRMTQLLNLPDSRYETLWTNGNMAKETQLAKARLKEARQLADGTAFPSSYKAFVKEIEARFASRECPLEPGEVAAIAKMMAYTVDEAPRLEPDVELQETRWFAALTQTIAADPSLMDDEHDRNEVVAHYVFNEVLYEAILLGFHIIEHKVKDNVGSYTERVKYANQVLTWLAGTGHANVSYFYFPLIMGGLSIARLVQNNKFENPWDLIDQVLEASNQRLETADEESIVVFEMLHEVVNGMSTTLRAQRIERH